MNTQPPPALPRLTLGPFAVAADGTLSARAPGLSPAIRFIWRGRACEALVQEGALRLRAIAGRIPSTAEPGADRHFTARAVAELPAAMPPGWLLRLTADHRVALEHQVTPRATAVALLTEMVRFALALDPHLDRLEGVGAR
ncbi:hypothetical protein KTR66_00845 [Roseococcus sp. SDR]|uniref:hypothetical protein n=1 Tax=Roseococcus sp. SDR TaxID=2835532 RepID=UPI001BD1972A|nr:hypothetical protein [Roseococcus sp. SDR]MBS7788517.1 hypothetical protein [Roseococcus sp. SDR]MBV1843831.1 hypothetical protein [Roseococcus sp. SDR]